MKALLRSSAVALILFAGYAALATDLSKPTGFFPWPTKPQTPTNPCVTGPIGLGR